MNRAQKARKKNWLPGGGAALPKIRHSKADAAYLSLARPVARVSVKAYKKFLTFWHDTTSLTFNKIKHRHYQWI